MRAEDKSQSLHARVYGVRWHVVASTAHVSAQFRTHAMYPKATHVNEVMAGKDLPRVPINKFHLIRYVDNRGQFLPESSSWRGDPVYRYTEFLVYPPRTSDHWDGWDQKHHRDDLWPKRFHDYGEAIAFAQREAFREKVKELFAAATNDDEFLDTLACFWGFRMGEVNYIASAFGGLGI